MSLANGQRTHWIMANCSDWGLNPGPFAHCPKVLPLCKPNSRTVAFNRQLQECQPSVTSLQLSYSNRKQCSKWACLCSRQTILDTSILNFKNTIIGRGGRSLRTRVKSQKTVFRGCFSSSDIPKTKVGSLDLSLRCFNPLSHLPAPFFLLRRFYY